MIQIGTLKIILFSAKYFCLDFCKKDFFPNSSEFLSRKYLFLHDFSTTKKGYFRYILFLKMFFFIVDQVIVINIFHFID